MQQEVSDIVSTGPTDVKGQELGPWSKAERQHINVQELKAAKHSTKPVNSIHLQIYIENGGTHSLQLSKVANEILDYIIRHKITITAEYLPSEQNLEADCES